MGLVCQQARWVERMCLPADEVCYNKLGGRASGAVKTALFPLIR